MLIYVMIFLPIIFFAFLGSFLEKNFHKKICLIISLSIIGIFIGTRKGIGIDYWPYVDVFNMIEGFSFNEIFTSMETIKFESGFVFLNFICAKLNVGYIGMFFLIEMLSLIFIYKGLIYWINNDKRRYLIVLIYMTGIFFASTNGVRQFFVASIFVYASKFLFEKKYKKYIICILIMSTFHMSSIFLIILIFIRNLNFTYKKYIFIIMILFIFGKYLGEFFYNNILINLGEKYSFYSGVEGYNMEAYSKNYVSIFLIIDTIIGFMLVKYEKFFNDKIRFLNKFFLFFVILKWGLGGYPLIARFNNYFYIFTIFGGANLVDILIEKYRLSENAAQLSVAAYYTVFYMYSLLFYLQNPAQFIIPYKNAFF